MYYFFEQDEGGETLVIMSFFSGAGSLCSAPEAPGPSAPR